LVGSTERNKTRESLAQTTPELAGAKRAELFETGASTVGGKSIKKNRVGDTLEGVRRNQIVAQREN